MSSRTGYEPTSLATGMGNDSSCMSVCALFLRFFSHQWSFAVSRVA